MRFSFRLLDKVGVSGVVIAGLSCTACFPALGALATTLGLGFLGSYEGVMINSLLPLLAMFTLLVNAYSWYRDRVHWRGFLAVIGPIAILAVLYPLWQYTWSTYLFYGALVLMLVVSVADLLWPVKAHCSVSLALEKNVVTCSEITCPYCGSHKIEEMPTNACQWFYECVCCKQIIRPKAGDCCVFCSYGTVKCPPKQSGHNCCEL